MKLVMKIAFVTGVLALACGSAALAAKPADVPKGKGPVYTPADPPTPGPKDGLPAQAKAYGRCVRNMAQAAKQEHKAPGQICKGESKKHVKGEKGTAFSRCVKAVVALRKQEREKEKEEAAV